MSVPISSRTGETRYARTTAFVVVIVALPAMLSLAGEGPVAEPARPAPGSDAAVTEKPPPKNGPTALGADDQVDQPALPPRLRTRIRGPAFRTHLQDLLLELCRLDTTPSPDVALLRQREAAVFDVLERELHTVRLPAAHTERRPIPATIQRHPAYTPLHFTKTDQRPEGLTADEAYAGRGNLLFLADGRAGPDDGRGLVFHAHIDVVAPFFPPRVEAGVVYGRGACDDKGNVVALVGALQALGEYLEDSRLPLPRRLTGMFVVEEETGGNGFLIEVHGAAGHMGSIRENDGAITKMATMVRALVLSRDRLQALAGSPPILELASRQNRQSLTLEGGQGFVPTHPMQEIMQRLTRAAERGAEDYLRLRGHPGSGREALRVSYDKLHNAAYDGEPDSPAMQHALAVARACGLGAADQPIAGWTVSCDARLFATEYPGKAVITTGAGRLEYAHSDQEHIRLEDVVKAVEFLTLYILRETAAGERASAAGPPSL